MTSTLNRVVFFVMLGVVFSIFFLATGYFYSNTNSTSSLKRSGIVVISSIIFSLFFVGYIQITGLLKEGFNFYTDPGPKICRGGPYTWQGNSERAKYCRKLASTPEGEQKIKRYDCGSGLSGMPGHGFNYTPISDDYWTNKRCDIEAKCDIESNGIF